MFPWSGDFNILSSRNSHVHRRELFYSQIKIHWVCLHSYDRFSFVVALLCCSHLWLGAWTQTECDQSRRDLVIRIQAYPFLSLSKCKQSEKIFLDISVSSTLLQSGFYVYYFLESYASGGNLLIVGFLECVLIVWIYGRFLSFTDLLGLLGFSIVLSHDCTTFICICAAM